jgi:hypothetical protein
LQSNVQPLDPDGVLLTFLSSGGSGLQRKQFPPWTEIESIEHAPHTPAPLGSYPAWHWNVHVVLSAVLVYTVFGGPEPHATALIWPGPGHLNPSGQVRQLLAPAEGACDPGAQSVHDEICPLPYLPGGQAVHTRAYPPALYAPAAHAVHAPPSVLVPPGHPVRVYPALHWAHAWHVPVLAPPHPDCRWFAPQLGHPVHVPATLPPQLARYCSALHVSALHARHPVLPALAA